MGKIQSQLEKALTPKTGNEAKFSSRDKQASYAIAEAALRTRFSN